MQGTLLHGLQNNSPSPLSTHMLSSKLAANNPVILDLYKPFSPRPFITPG